MEHVLLYIHIILPAYSGKENIEAIKSNYLVDHSRKPHIGTQNKELDSRAAPLPLICIASVFPSIVLQYARQVWNGRIPMAVRLNSCRG